MNKTLILTGLALVASPTLAAAQGTAFTYQGRLNDGGNSAHGTYDFRFKLFVDAFGNTQVGSTVLTNGVPMTDGLFTVTIDFGAGVFNGSNYWLETDVKTNNAGSYVDLSPLQAVTPAPYAIFAGAASTLTGILPAAQLSGTYGSAVTLNNAANRFAGTFTGNAAGLTNVNAATLGGVSAEQFWKTTGNSNTVTGVNFLGTGDSQPLELWVNQARVLRLEPGTNVYSIVGAPNVIAGAPNNFVDGGIVGATIAGGGALNMTGYLPGPSSNHVSAIFGTIGGGRLNAVGADHGFIGGGLLNMIQPYAYDSVIAGGTENTIQGYANKAVIAGGIGNINAGSYSSVGGGSGNTIQANAESSSIGGGQNNTNNGLWSALGGGYFNSIQDSGSAVIGGGWQNTVQNANQSTIAGGWQNTIGINAQNATIGGGVANTIGYNGNSATIGGGGQNTIQSGAEASVIAGGYNNSIQTNSDSSAIVGGYLNSIQTNSSYSAIGGGFQNTVQVNASYSTIAGGINNRIQSGAEMSFVGGGFGNTAGSNSYYASIVGGIGNTIDVNAESSFIGGGQINTIGADASYGMIPGGYGNSVLGRYGFAAGQNAQANHDGAFVWSDVSSPSSFSSVAQNEFAIRAHGGVRLETAGAGMTLDGQPIATANNVALLNADQTFSGANTFASDIRIEGGAPYHHLELSGGNALGYLYGSYPSLILGDGIHLGYNWYADALGVGHLSNGGGGTSRVSVSYNSIVLATGDVGVEPNFQNLVVSGTTTTANGTFTVNGTFNNASDRNAKQDFAPVDPSQILEKVARLPVSEWSYKTDATTRHIGPVAQDFCAVFKIGTDDKHIAPIDEGGVALAAIQGLNQKVDSENAKLREELNHRNTENAELRRQHESFAKRLEKLEELLEKQTVSR